MPRLPRMASLLPVACTISATSPPPSEAGAPRPAHHTAKGGFVNPWESFYNLPTNPLTAWKVYKDWTSHPVPPPELLPQVVKPDWGVKPGEDQAKWDADIKSTWLGHACFLVELPKLAHQERGIRILFDPVFSCRCSPSQLAGPARVTKPPFDLKELPHVDAVVISHNHYDHLDVATLQHIHKSQPAGTVKFFAPLNNAKWFKSIGIPDAVELDWWDARDLAVALPLAAAQDGDGAEREAATVRLTCTPCQHFTGRTPFDRFETLWASWAAESVPSAGAPAGRAAVFFGGDTGYRAVPRGTTDESKLPTCPAFKEIGAKLGPFDLAHLPIGAYEPRWAMSPVHCSPADAVCVHEDVRSRKSVGMHWGTWILTCEEMCEPPKALRRACEAKGISEEQFGVCDIGQTTRVTPAV